MFHVEARTIHYQRDSRSNYVTAYRTDRDQLEGYTLDDLYEQMASYKARNVVETNGSFRERSEVEFDTIFESVAYGEFEPNRLEETAAWKKHLEAVSEAKQAETDRLVKTEAEKTAKVAANEKALLASLLAKHGQP